MIGFKVAMPALVKPASEDINAVPNGPTALNKHTMFQGTDFFASSAKFKVGLPLKRTALRIKMNTRQIPIAPCVESKVFKKPSGNMLGI